MRRLVVSPANFDQAVAFMRKHRVDFTTSEALDELAEVLENVRQQALKDAAEWCENVGRRTPSPYESVAFECVNVIRRRAAMSSTSLARLVGFEQIVASLRSQLLASHGFDAHYVDRYTVRGWTVLEFRAATLVGRPLHVIVDGSGPGQAAWVVGASSAEQALEASEWNASMRREAEAANSQEPQLLDGTRRELPP